MVKRRLLPMIFVISLLIFSVNAKPIQWVDFSVPYESLKYAMNVDIETAGQEKHISWIDILAVAACRTGGKCPLSAVKTAAKQLRGDHPPDDLLGELY